MGNWNINIQGVGSHHNANNKWDANRMAAKFVEDLKAAGHDVQVAAFTHGGLEPLLAARNPEGYRVLYDGASPTAAPNDKLTDAGPETP